jgi:hypothetical protein
MQHHHLPAAEPDQRRRTVVDSHRRSDPGRPPLPSVTARAIKLPPPRWHVGPAPQCRSPRRPSLLGQLGRQPRRARARARVGRNTPPGPARQENPFSFYFLFSFPIFLI